MDVFFPPAPVTLALCHPAHPPNKGRTGGGDFEKLAVRVRSLHCYQSPFITPSSLFEVKARQLRNPAHPPIWQWELGGWSELNHVFGQSSPTFTIISDFNSRFFMRAMCCNTQEKKISLEKKGKGQKAFRLFTVWLGDVLSRFDLQTFKIL